MATSCVAGSEHIVLAGGCVGVAVAVDLGDGVDIGVLVAVSFTDGVGLNVGVATAVGVTSPNRPQPQGRSFTRT